MCVRSWSGMRYHSLYACFHFSSFSSFPLFLFQLYILYIFSPRNIFCAFIFIVLDGAFICHCMEQQCQTVAGWDKCSWIFPVVKSLGPVTSILVTCDLSVSTERRERHIKQPVTEELSPLCAFPRNFTRFVLILNTMLGNKL